MPSEAFSTRALEGRISREEGIDQHDLVGEVEPECGMSQPGDFHGILAVFGLS